MNDHEQDNLSPSPEGADTNASGNGQPRATAEELNPEQLLQALQDAQANAEQSWKQLLLARADMENVRRRAERDVEAAYKYALEKFVRELLPVKDSLELGLAATGEGTEVSKLREGVDLTLKMLASALEKFGVTEVNPKGDKFNPERHQAMATQPVADMEPNTVLAVYQKGYLLNDRLIRPALVVVSSAPTRQEAEERA